MEVRQLYNCEFARLLSHPTYCDCRSVDHTRGAFPQNSLILSLALRLGLEGRVEETQWRGIPELRFTIVSTMVRARTRITSRRNHGISVYGKRGR